MIGKKGRVRKKLKRILVYFSYFLFPNRCPFCGEVIRIDDLICDLCGKEIQNEFYMGTEILGDSNIRQITTVFNLEGAVKKGLYRAKFHGKPYGFHAFSFYMSEKIREVYGDYFFDAVLYIPQTKKEKRRSGYNAAALLAKSISRKMDLPCRGDILVKVRETEPQHNLNREARQKNLKSAFDVDGKKCEGLQKILLVDDIYTTGATFRECAAALNKYKNIEIYCTAFAVTPMGTVEV